MHGDCPSIVVQNRDTESLHLLSVRNRLVNITLKEHTYCVALNLIRAIKKNYTDYNVHIPGALITALAHDIGKIPDFMASVSDTGEHHIISSRRLAEMFAGKNQTLAAKVIRAVENHHSYVEDGFSQMLKQADREARQAELLKLSENSKVAPLGSWFSLEKFYKRLEPHINFSKGAAGWKAFTFKGFVYCRPDLICQISKDLCKESDIVDLTFLDESALEEVLDKVFRHLRDHDMIPDHFKTNRFSRRYVIKTCIGHSYKAMLTPVKPAGFYNMKEIESRKIGFLEIIKSVWPG
jgi:hypothetical protein